MGQLGCVEWHSVAGLMRCGRRWWCRLVGYALMLLSVFSAPAFAWDGYVSGTITQIDTVAETNNYETRIYVGGATVCNNTSPDLATLGYLNSSDPNYKAVVANLMLAYTMGRKVEIFTMNDNNVGCHIHYVKVHG